MQEVQFAGLKKIIWHEIRNIQFGKRNFFFLIVIWWKYLPCKSHDFGGFGMTLDKVDEMNSLVAGANFLLMVGFLKYKDMLI